VIIDRKRNIFSLCPNKYIALGKIENVYLRCPLVSECLIHYDTRHSILVSSILLVYAMYFPFVAVLKVYYMQITYMQLSPPSPVYYLLKYSSNLVISFLSTAEVFRAQASFEI